MARRVWTEDEIAVALAYYEANNKQLNKTAKDCNVPRTSLQRWIRAQRNGPPGPSSGPLKEKVEIALADRLEELAHKLAGMIEESAVDASTRDQAGALLVAVDKMQVLRKQPTQINEVRETLTAEQRIDMLSAIFTKAQQRRDEAALPPLLPPLGGGAPN